MKKQELLEIMDDVLLDKLFGFCYARTRDSYEAQELCSDIVFALVKTANTTGDITDLYPFIWRTARNVYADFCKKQKKSAAIFYQDDPSDVLSSAFAEEDGDDDEDLLKWVYQRISFLTRAYREVMILYYLDGLSTAEIARRQNISETAVRQRLFSARKKIKDEVENMADMNPKPVALDTINLVLSGTGNPSWGDPRNLCTRQFSKHIIWLCRKKPLNALEIAEKLNVPTVYVEEELEILTNGENGEYGLLRRLDSGKYVINFILLDKEEINKAWEIYQGYVPMICDRIAEYIKEHKEEYLAFPYLNKKVELNLVLWQQLKTLSESFSSLVRWLLIEEHFPETGLIPYYPFRVYGYQDNGKYHGGSWNGTSAKNICGFTEIHAESISTVYIKDHFYSGHDIANDVPLQLALRSIEGLDINTLSVMEKEYAAKAIEKGYLYREGDMLCTKILVNDMKDRHKLFHISSNLPSGNGIFGAKAEEAAKKIADLIRSVVPEHLSSEFLFVNDLATIPMQGAVEEALIQRGILIPPEDGVGAEGCWMSVMQPQKEADKKKVLIVDDAPFIRNVLTEWLEAEYQILTAEDGEEGVDKFKKECFDAVLLDINMPKLGGVDALRQMREINNHARIIMVTAVDRQEVMDECKSLGAPDYIMKPFGMEQILQALHTALDGEQNGI